MEHSKEMVKLAVQALQDKKGEDVKIIDIREISVLADYFVIASGSNGNQVQAMADNVEEMLGKAGYVSAQIEGYNSANWILMDYKELSSIYSAAKTDYSMIWNVSGEMERRLLT